MAQTTTPLPYYNIDPTIQGGQGAYGAVPGTIGIPPSEFQQVGAIYPGLTDQAAEASGNINAELMGQLSPETVAALQQHAAQFGLSSGLPGSQFSGNQGAAQLGLTTEQLQSQGLKDYLTATQGIGSMLTPQSLAAEIANRNATMSAAPNPQAAAAQQMANWQQQFAASQGAAGSRGPGGGTGTAPFANPGTDVGSPGPYSGTGPFAAPPTSSGPVSLPPGMTYGNTPTTSNPNLTYVGDGMYYNSQTGEMTDANGNVINMGDYVSPSGPTGGYSDVIPPDTYVYPSTGQATYDPLGTGGAFDQTGTSYPDTGSSGDISDPFGIYGG